MGAADHTHTHTHTRTLFGLKGGMEYVTTRMNLEDITLSEISRSQRNKYHTSPLSMSYLQRSNSESKTGMVAAPGWERGQRDH